MDDVSKVENLLADPGLTLEPDQWYLVRMTAYVRRPARGRPEVQGFKVDAIEVDGPESEPPEEPEEPETP